MKTVVSPPPKDNRFPALMQGNYKNSIYLVTETKPFIFQCIELHGNDVGETFKLDKLHLLIMMRFSSKRLSLSNI